VLFRSVSKEAKAGIEAHVIFNMNEANEKLKAKTRELIRQAYLGGLQLGLQETAGNIDFSLYEANILRAVEQRVGFFAEKVNQSTADLLAEALKAGIEKGETIETIAGRVDRIFRYSEDYRSRRTAQTEVIGATNDGNLRAYRETGVEAKEWVTARDERVRDSHQALEGKIVEINDTFVTGDGNRLQYPGDRSTGAPPEEVINCRCCVNPVVKKGV
jgi:SPP1 gp7 family putative phage head morphogenesis protein